MAAAVTGFVLMGSTASEQKLQCPDCTWYWYMKAGRQTNKNTLIPYAPFMNETKTERAILKKLLNAPKRIVSSFCVTGISFKI
ncbi:hypothetical protein ANCCAN_30027 [Ancylostoma caninum]|uniref:Uncharacterized protein n=1 Tax=Ancylostoma caninum TaxID=29170 RepID=A0A368EX01_ANCCA|nr:hypothetical protein ANCCAN_30027 [Ancylostoma caninum]